MNTGFDYKKLYKRLKRATLINLCVVFAFVAASFFVNRTFAFWLLGLAVTYALYVLITSAKRKRDLHKYIGNISSYINSQSSNAIINLPIPIVIADFGGDIAWYNNEFGNIMNDDELFGVSLQEKIPGFSIMNLVENHSDVPLEIEHNGRFFNVLSHAVEREDILDGKKILVMYWFDKTDEKNLLELYNNERAVECIVMVDNYDEVLQNTPDANHSAIIAEIEKTIHQFAAEYDGLIRKFERDKFSVLLFDRDLKKIVESKFDILDKIREINMENQIPATLSIGVGKNGENIIENDKFARLGIDMSLGRGGDQAVIYDGDVFEFFGAKSREVEKRTKVKARVVAHALWELMQKSDKVIIMGHKNADLDSFGASLGVYRAAVSAGKAGYIVTGAVGGVVKKLVDKIMDKPEYNGVILSGEQAENICTRDTLVIMVDTHKPSYLAYPELLNESESVVLIDHHRRGTEFFDTAVLTYHEPYASSACEMVTEMLQYMPGSPKLSVFEAEALYAGLMLDTKGFSVKTGVRTFEAAAYLRRIGVDPLEVKKIFKTGLDNFVKKAEIISQTRILRESIAISSFESDNREVLSLVAASSDELLNISGISAAFVLVKIENIVYISGRSFGEINVQVILEKLGGGGHMMVAGAQVESEKLSDAEERLQTAIDEALAE